MSDRTKEPLLMVRLNYVREKFRCANKPAAKIAKSPAQRIAGFNPSSRRRFRWFSKRETTRCPSGRGTPMRSKMDLSIHRLKARSSRFSVTAIAFLNIGPADSICVAVSEKNFICARCIVSIFLFLKIETIGNVKVNDLTRVRFSK